jgi:hypothetical protein
MIRRTGLENSLQHVDKYQVLSGPEFNARISATGTHMRHGLLQALVDIKPLAITYAQEHSCRWILKVKESVVPFHFLVF